MRLQLTVKDKQGTALMSALGEQEAILAYEPEYKEGDYLLIESDGQNVFLLLQLDDAIMPAFVYLSGQQYTLQIPFGEKRKPYSPRAFMGTHHVLCVRFATDDEIQMRKNLAFNPYDEHENHSLFPHASANVETRGESVFAARNAIDGIKCNHNHGEWPFQSWGINQNPDAEIKIDFGRAVSINQALIYLRADFPHDSWWEQVTLMFSDGSQLDAPLIKTSEGQSVMFESRTVNWIKMNRLIKSNNPSPFPALTQIELYGTEDWKENI